MGKAPMLPSCRLIIAVLIIVPVNLLMMITLAHFHRFGRVVLVVGMIFLALVIMVRKEAARAPIWFVVLLTIPVQLPQLFFQPRTSDDVYRYIWDRPRAACGCRSLPLRPFGFRAWPGSATPCSSRKGEPPLINRPGVPTIDPPIAQLCFALVAFFTPRAAGTLGLQIAAAGAVVLTTWLLARFLGNRQGWALLYRACPAVALGIIVLVGLRRWGKAATNAGNYTPAGTAPRSSGVGREQQARLE
jgi:hypothetical protein